MTLCVICKLIIITLSIDYIEYIQSLSEATNIKNNWFGALLNYNLSVVELEYLTAKK